MGTGVRLDWDPCRRARPSCMPTSMPSTPRSATPHPCLRGRPIAVGGGVVLAASYEAKRFGVQGGMAGWRAKRLCPGLTFVRGHFSEYQKPRGPGHGRPRGLHAARATRSRSTRPSSTSPGRPPVGLPRPSVSRSDVGPIRDRTPHLGRRGADQAPGQDRLAGRQAGRVGGGAPGARTRLPRAAPGQARLGSVR